MGREAKHLFQALYIVLFHFGAAYFAASAFFSVDLAFLVGLLFAGIAVLIYLVLVLTDNADEGVLIGLLYVSPIIYVTTGIIWWIARLILEYFDNWPPRF